MNLNEPSNTPRRHVVKFASTKGEFAPESIPGDDELRQLASDICKYSPGLLHLCLALGCKGRKNPLAGLN